MKKKQCDFWCTLAHAHIVWNLSTPLFWLWAHFLVVSILFLVAITFFVANGLFLVARSLFLLRAWNSSIQRHTKHTLLNYLVWMIAQTRLKSCQDQNKKFDGIQAKCSQSQFLSEMSSAAHWQHPFPGIHLLEMGVVSGHSFPTKIEIGYEWNIMLLWKKVWIK